MTFCIYITRINMEAFNLLTENISGEEPIQSLNWSARLKHSDISIKGRLISRIGDGRNRYKHWGICSLSNPLAENRDIQKWSVRLNAFKYWVCVGICQIDPILEHQF